MAPLPPSIRGFTDVVNTVTGGAVDQAANDAFDSFVAKAKAAFWQFVRDHWVLISIVCLILLYVLAATLHGYYVNEPICAFIRWYRGGSKKKKKKTKKGTSGGKTQGKRKGKSWLSELLGGSSSKQKNGKTKKKGDGGTEEKLRKGSSAGSSAVVNEKGNPV